jgi:hypothetical protein
MSITEILIVETSSRDMLLRLLEDMNRFHGRQPDEIDLSEMTGQDKHFLVVTCAAALAWMSICSVAKDRDDAMQGLESLIETMRAKIEEHYRKKGKAN